jgi:hypothetical protein
MGVYPVGDLSFVLVVLLRVSCSCKQGIWEDNHCYVSSWKWPSNALTQHDDEDYL